MFDNRNLKLDLFALALLAVGVFLALALFTYDPGDPPSTVIYPSSTEIHNICGRSGALLAHYLFQATGVGAYYLIFSLATLDFLMLLRRDINQPVLRTIGWLMSLLGITTMATLLFPESSSGPLIGPGGYLGAVGVGLLEMNFAMVGSFILTLSVLLAGILLCTDYVVFQMIGRTVGFATGGFRNISLPQRRPKAKKQAEPEDEYEQEQCDEEYEEEDEYDEYEIEEEPDEQLTIKVRGQGDSEDDFEEEEEEDEYEEEDELEEEPEESEAEEPVKESVKKRLAGALRIRKPKKQPKKTERDEVIEELDAANEVDAPLDYQLPSMELLLEGEDFSFEQHEKEVRRKAKLLERTFESFGLSVKVVEIETGPVIAQYEVQLEAGLRLSKVTALADDIAIALRVPSVRIVAPIPGKNSVGIEVPNEHRQIVRMREVMEEANGRAKRMNIPVYLGKDVSGKPMVVDLASMPHLLIAGRTGTGKSVCLNSIIVSMLMTRRPDEVRMLMVDPKMVELSPYKKLPHLMHPVVTDMRKAEAIMAWAVDKMEERYQMLARAGVRHVTVYNQLGEEELRRRLEPETEEEWESIPKNLPFIVIVADEIADLMMTAGKDVEQHIIRLAQKSRAVGIHLILATQKPTVDVITGLIKSNLPARIAFQVSSRTDSRVVLDEMGADKLLGNGDMLFLQPGTSMLLRGQGTYLSDDEINSVIDSVATAEPQYAAELVQLKAKDEEGNEPGKLKNRDDLYESAVDIVVRERRGSVSLLQRSLGIGYGRGARLIDFMAEDGIVGPYNGSQAREVLLSMEDWEAMNGEGGEAEPASSPPPKPKRSNKISLHAETEEPSQATESAPWEEEADEQDEAAASLEDEQYEDGEDDEDADDELDSEEEYEDDEYEEEEDEDEEYDEEEDEEEYEDDELVAEEDSDEDPEAEDEEEWEYEEEDEEGDEVDDEAEEDEEWEYEYEEYEEEDDDESSSDHAKSA